MLHANVAILESNEQFAQELKQFFAENTDLNVCGVSDDGIAGVDMIQNTNPDVILLSLILKGIDGFTVLDKLRESGKKVQRDRHGEFCERRDRIDCDEQGCEILSDQTLCARSRCGADHGTFKK